MEAIESIERELQIICEDEDKVERGPHDHTFINLGYSGSIFQRERRRTREFEKANSGGPAIIPEKGSEQFDEKRIDVIGQNGNEGEHYDQEYRGPTWWMTCPSCNGLSVIGVDTWMPCTCCGVKFKVSMDEISKAQRERKLKFERAEDDWSSHEGGICPVKEGTRIEVEYRNGDRSFTNAQLIGWDHYHQEDDIVRYRLA